MERTQASRARFGSFELDLRAGELRANGNSALLPDQVLQVLCLLVERQGDLVSREELKSKLWPNDTVVEFDHGINNTIKRLRKFLNDSAEEPSYIETIPRRGYRLMVPVEWTSTDESSGDASRAAIQDSGLIGIKVSHYRVLKVIGGGGMGMVYEAEDLKLGRRVALKFLPEELATDSLALQRFEREARTASSLSHPNICTIYEVEEYEGRPFIVMELLEGETLRERLAASETKALPLDQLLDIGLQICDGLQAAHGKGIIHRDIKPANIFITDKNVAKILDFGVAKVMVSEPAADLPSREQPTSSDGGAEGLAVNQATDTADLSTAYPPGMPGGHSAQDDSVRVGEFTLTRTGVKLGTAGYMSPEQVRGEPLDPRTDIFSFGLVLYEMATGERAFTGETEAILHDAILHSEPKPIGELAPEISSDLQELIAQCLRKSRNDRYQSVSELRAKLVVTSNDGQRSSGSKARKRKRVWVPAAVGLVFVAVLFAGIYRRYARPTSSADTEVTTSSPEALHAFMQAGELRAKDRGDPAPYYKRAIELEPEFALAYLSLGTLYLNRGKQEEGILYLKRAYELRSHASRAEQLMIEANYYFRGTGELDKAVMRFEEWSRLRPDSASPYMSLSYIYNVIGQPDQAIAPARNAIRLGVNLGYGNLIASYFKLSRFDDAKAVFAEAQSHGIESNFLIEYRYLLAELENDDLTMRQQLERARSDPSLNEWAIRQQGDTAFARGRLREAQRFYSILPNFAADDPERVAESALADYEVGYVHQAQRKAAQALASPVSHTTRSKCNLSVFYGRTGNTETATRLLHDIDVAYPTDLLVQRLEIPTLKAAIALGNSDPAGAIRLLEPTVPYELTGVSCVAGLEPAYLRGLAYLQLGKGSDATAEFQRVVNHRIILENERILRLLSFLYLGRAQVMMGDKVVARKSYQDFLTLWKDADPDIPIYKQAKAEYAKLQ
jgi:pentatricopeptide repeat protein